MTAIVAFGAVSALGEGEAALGVGPAGAVAERRVIRDAELAEAGLARPWCARARIDADGGEGSEGGCAHGRDRATALLARALEGCERDLDRVMPGWRALRVGLALGTSSGGMRAFERARASASVSASASESGLEGTYLGPVVEALRARALSASVLPRAFEPYALVLGACASATLAIGVARAWLRAGLCDVALCGGFDAVSVFVAAGFESLHAVCTERGPAPFRAGRDGLALGEGAAILALVSGAAGTPRDASGIARRSPPAPPAPPPALAHIAGFGASCDALHLTAPDETGAGLARAARAALDEAALGAVELVSAHGTATRFNDASEARALASLGALDAPVHALKGSIGHTLGAAGALETLAAAVAMRDGVLPASAGDGARELRVVDRAEPFDASAAIKLSSAFGGANAALVVTRARASVDAPSARAVESSSPSSSSSSSPSPSPSSSSLSSPPSPPSRAPRRAWVSRAVAIVAGAIAGATDPSSLGARTGYAVDRLARADLLVRLVLAAARELEGEVGALRGAGIVVGQGLATLDTNQTYLARIREAGARRAEPRRFPYTTPNAAAGECAVALGLTGPSFAVGGGPHGGIEALAVAAALVSGGAADRVVVVAADEAGEASRRLAPGTEPGAVALLVSAEPLAARLGRCAVRFEPCPEPLHARPLPPMHAHRALLPLASGRPGRLDVALPWGGFANAEFLWL